VCRRGDHKHAHQSGGENSESRIFDHGVPKSVRPFRARGRLSSVEHNGSPFCLLCSRVAAQPPDTITDPTIPAPTLAARQPHFFGFAFCSALTPP